MLSDRQSLRCGVKWKIVNTPTSEKIPNLYPHRALNRKNMVCSVVNLSILNRVYQRFINIKVSISGEMAIIPYIHKQILLRINIEHPSLNVQDFYYLLTTLATCLISIECGVRCSPPPPPPPPPGTIEIFVVWLCQYT